MTAAAIRAYPDAGKFESAVLAVLVHLVLFALLFFGVQWQSATPEAVEVELWDRVPAFEPAPPPPVQLIPEVKPEPVAEPKPEPAPPPDIALKEKLEKKKREEQKKVEDAKRRDADREQTLKDQRDRLRKESELLQSQREVNEEQNRIAAQRASAKNRSANEYVAKIRSKIRGNISVPEGIIGNPEAVFDVVQLPSGDILSVKLRTGSGHAAYDSAVERAILKSSPLPKPGDPQLFQRDLVLKFRPQEHP